MDFRESSARSLAHAVRAKEISATELVTASLERIEALNPKLNAFVAVDAEAALADARSLDERIARGEDPGPLAGLPFGVKDTDDVVGYRTTFGSATKADNPIATGDSALVARMRAAGAIVVGKTNMPEFGLKATTDNPLFGTTYSPWGEGKTPGGSSGGSSAAVAAGMVPLATASDGGGSIRIPSSLTGLSGFKPTTGYMPNSDEAPPGWPLLSSKGVLATTIADVTHALDVTRGPSDLDLRTLPSDPVPWMQGLEEHGQQLRFAWSPTLGYATVDAEIEASCRAMADLLVNAGHIVDELPKPFIEPPGIAVGVLVSAYMSRMTTPLRGTRLWDKLDAQVALMSEVADASVSAVDVVDALDRCHRANGELLSSMEGYHFLLSPTTNGHTPDAQVPVPSAFLAAAITHMPELLGEMDDATKAKVLSMVEGYGEINLPLGLINGVPSIEWFVMTQPFNAIGWPAGTVCSGISSAGMPIGLQVVGRRFDDGRVLNAIHLLETLRGPMEWPAL